MKWLVIGSVLGEEGKATHTQEEVKKDETPLKMEVTDESKSKGHPPTPPPQSPPPTPPELPVAKQPVLTVAEGNHAKQELTKILTDAFHRLRMYSVILSFTLLIIISLV